MVHNFDYKTIWDAFTLAASRVVAEGAFDAVRASLDAGHEVSINMGQGQHPIRFKKKEDFELWVQELKDKI
jgi:hypothetical protein